VNLVIDLGNTNAKVGVFDGEELVHHQYYPLPQAGDSQEGKAVLGHSMERIFEQGVLQVQDKFKIQASIISSVINHQDDFDNDLAATSKLVRFNHETPLPIVLNYDTPQTLGLDRIANAVGIAAQSKGNNVLSIDIGTCIKYDLVDTENTYQGGGISPGYQMRFKALNTFTQKLPLIEQQKIQHHVGKNTEQSILSGVYNGMHHEIEGMIQGYSKQYSGLQIVVTGGDAHHFELDTKNAIFADAFLTLRGLNLILQHNV
jgi:type III pantothenate kinase